MTQTLQHHDDDSAARCVRCGGEAAGPCASCHLPVCGDCSVLTKGGARVWAICLGCADRKGGSLSGEWRRLLVWLVAILLGLALLTWTLGMFVGTR